MNRHRRILPGHEESAAAAGRRMRVICAAGLLCAAFVSVARGEIEAVVGVEKVARLTGTEGSDSINPTWKEGIGGTDLGHMINLGERTFFVFGDTFSSERTGDGWRWNSMAYTTDTLAMDGITFAGWITDGAGRARAIIEDKRANPVTNIPTGGIALGGRMHVFYMAMKFWGDAGNPCWQAHYSGHAWSDDGGGTFRVEEGFAFPNGSHMGMVALACGQDDPRLKDGHVFVWGTPANRCGGVKLARVRPGEIGRREAWEFFAGLEPDGQSGGGVGGPSGGQMGEGLGGGVGGRAMWTDSEEASPLVVAPKVGEMSVMYNRWAGCWMMLHLHFGAEQNPITDVGRVVLRQAPAPWGPWSEPMQVATASEYPGLPYGSYMNPRYVENGGESAYFTMSLWDPYDVYWMKMTLRRR